MIQTLKMCEKRNRRCSWVKKDGRCAWEISGCLPIVKKCLDCTNIQADSDGTKYCTIFTYPNGQWEYGNCAKATHLMKIETAKIRARNPLKASKKAKKGY